MKKILLIPALFLTFSLAAHAQSTKAKTGDVTATEHAKEKDAMKNGMAEAMSAMGSMGPMLTNMTKSLMDAQLEYYKQPGKLEEIAKLNKQYFDALVKEGFTNDQALKIITSDSLLPKSSGVK